MQVDEQLLQQSNKVSEESLAGNFRASRRGQLAPSQNNSQGRISLRAQRMAQIRQENFKEKLKAKAVDKLKNNPLRKMTDKLLRGAWLNLIDSFGATLLWIDIHILGNKIFGPTVFAPLGEEWLPPQASNAHGDAAKSSMALIKKVEGSGVGCLNLVLLIVITFICLMLVLIISVLDPSEGVKVIYEMIREGLSDLIVIIKKG